MPTKRTMNTTKIRFGTRPISASGTAEAVRDSPKSRRREKSPNGRVPNAMPNAMPMKIAANTRPHPAGPPCRVCVM